MSCGLAAVRRMKKTEFLWVDDGDAVKRRRRVHPATPINCPNWTGDRGTILWGDLATVETTISVRGRYPPTRCDSLPGFRRWSGNQQWLCLRQCLQACDPAVCAVVPVFQQLACKGFVELGPMRTGFQRTGPHSDPSSRVRCGIDHRSWACPLEGEVDQPLSGIPVRGLYTPDRQTVA